MTDPYKILEVDYEASDSEIKKAYYALARKCHPDNFASDPQLGEIANRKMREEIDLVLITPKKHTR